MHQIQVKVKLSNALDEMLINRDMLNPNQLRVYETEGFVDTDIDAVRTTVPMHIIQLLGLEIRYHEIAGFSDGSEEKTALSEPIIIEIQGRETTECVIIKGDKVLISRIALSTLDLFVDHENQCLIPNPEHPNYPVFRI